MLTILKISVLRSPASERSLRVILGELKVLAQAGGCLEEILKFLEFQGFLKKVLL